MLVIVPIVGPPLAVPCPIGGFVLVDQPPTVSLLKGFNILQSDMGKFTTMVPLVCICVGDPHSEESKS